MTKEDYVAKLKQETDTALMWYRTIFFASMTGIAASTGMQDGVDYIVTLACLGYIASVALMLGTLSIITYQDHIRDIAFEEAHSD